ncbi:hypothetical protein ASE73_07780 [Sphingomonas sp. Leaf24]|uniref:hypothetical protein n=1 Tax=unclassified Sphingomonas TaxID=196159 RepID=UPI0006F79882|nr:MULTISPECIES: hypothetical protein [unclassified Sphingomonas]KQM20213.1 hypothetical protein ASE50_16890 [Sphingomonas sp. Leaf5]KQM89476.1 hypothetical protein ASE73_07780 [Sphingomonas sp. Leaf24]
MMSEDASFATTSGPYRQRRSRGWLLVAVLAFLIGIGATLAVLRYVAPRLGWGGSTQAATPVAQPTPTPVPQPVAAVALPILSAREAALAARIADLETRIVGLDNSARNAAGYATRAEDMMVVVATRRALDRGRPLDYLEGQLRERFGDSRPDAVRTLIAAAQAPVTLDDLRTALDAVATPLVAGPTGEGFWNGLRREFGQLIVLRQGATPSSRPIDRLDRARRRLDTGQVEQAIAEIERMPGAASARRWTAAAERFVAARKALIDLESVALTMPRPAPAPQPAPLPAAPPPSESPVAADPVDPTL